MSLPGCAPNVLGPSGSRRAHRRSAHRLIADLGIDGRGDCFPQLLLRSDGEDAPLTGHALQLVRAPVFELKS